MSIKPEVSLGVALATGTVVWAIFQNALPSVADVRTAPAQDGHINAGRNMAAWTAAAVVAGVSLIARDPTVFTVGGAMVIVLDWWFRHANAVNPATGMASTVGQLGSAQPTGDLVPGYTDTMVG